MPTFFCMVMGVGLILFSVGDKEDNYGRAECSCNAHNPID